MAPPSFSPQPRLFDPVSYLDANAARRPRAPAVFDAGREVSFEELAGAVHGLIARFRAYATKTAPRPDRKHGVPPV